MFLYSLPSLSIEAGDTIAEVIQERAEANGADGRVSVTFTVDASTTSVSLIGNGARMGTRSAGSLRRSKFHLTAFASNGVPSWKTTPFRSLNVYTVPSGEIVQLSASQGL